jgi:hypothetical protein
MKPPTPIEAATALSDAILGEAAALHGCSKTDLIYALATLRGDGLPINPSTVPTLRTVATINAACITVCLDPRVPEMEKLADAAEADLMDGLIGSMLGGFDGPVQ